MSPGLSQPVPRGPQHWHITSELKPKGQCAACDPIIEDREHFGNQTGDRQNGLLVKRCLKCGALVAEPFQTHIDFHR